MVSAYQQLQFKKSIIIPQCCRGELTISQAAEKLDITARSVCRLKARYRKDGDKIFVRASVGHPAYNKVRYTQSFKLSIIKIYYDDNWQGCPYKTFCRALNDFYHMDIPYWLVRSILREYSIPPMKAIKPKDKPKHESRKERKHEGELIQMDASKHDWFMNGTYVNLHGAIDDATHQITGLYFTQNECRLGYNEVLRQTFTNYGIPGAVYIDRHSSFVTTPKARKEKRSFTMAEKLQSEKGSSTHFIDLCNSLNIDIILALSAQGKGRIERLWQTLQGILPFYFKKLKIDNCDAANRFIQEWVIQYNQEFRREPEKENHVYRPVPAGYDMDYNLAIKEAHRTDDDGYFVYHDFLFRIKSTSRARRKFILCLSEQFGIKAYYNNKYYDVELAEPLVSVRGDKMPQVEKELLNKYLLNDLHVNIYSG